MSWHNHLGMGLIFKVGSFKGLPEMPEKFPKCGDFDKLKSVNLLLVELEIFFVEISSHLKYT